MKTSMLAIAALFTLLAPGAACLADTPWEIVNRFGPKYDAATGGPLATAVLSKEVSANDGGKSRNYDSMHRLIATTWAGMEIRYELKGVEDEGCLSILHVDEFTEPEVWQSRFVFAKGGPYGWRLVRYVSEKK